MRALRLSVVALLCAAVVSTWGCAPTTGGEPPSTEAPPPPEARGKTPALEPGIEQIGAERVVARGWVGRSELEGGFWALYRTRPGSSSEESEAAEDGGIVAVLLPGEVSEERIARLEGTFIGAEGALQEGASIRMAGPEVVVDGIRAY